MLKSNNNKSKSPSLVQSLLLNTLARALLLAPLLSFSVQAFQANQLTPLINKIESKVIDWRRHFHANPELSNREFETAKTIAKHLKTLGLEVQTGVAHTGVVAILKGGLPGKVVALRADIDALPVTETVKLPFSSKGYSYGNINGRRGSLVAS